MSKTVTPEEYAELTPFAQAVLDWMWYENRPPIQNQVRLAERLGLPRSTVSSWFSPSKRALPEGRGWHAVAQATGWPDEKLLKLTGYTTPPVDRMTPWQFLRQQVQRRWGHEAAEIAQWIDEMEIAYRAAPAKRPPRRKRAVEQPPVAHTLEHTPAQTSQEPANPTPISEPRQPRERRAPVGSGK